MNLRHTFIQLALKYYQNSWCCIVVIISSIFYLQVCVTCKDPGTAWSTPTPHTPTFNLLLNWHVSFRKFSWRPEQVPAPVRRVWRQRGMPALRGSNLWRLQRIFQADSPKECKVCLSGRQKLPCRQTASKSMPVLSLSKVPDRRHGEGGGENWWAEGQKGPPAV